MTFQRHAFFGLGALPRRIGAWDVRAGDLPSHLQSDGGTVGVPPSLSYFYVAEPFTKQSGESVSLLDALEGIRQILPRLRAGPYHRQR